MKKTYNTPCVNIIQVQNVQTLAASGVTGELGDIAIGFGGIDEFGELDPCVKEEDLFGNENFGGGDEAW